MPFEFREAAESSLVSLVIPCYNAERFLADTLESALTQTYPHTEIIVVDDGSTDGSPQLIEAYGTRVKAEFGPHRGASAARNRGTAMARGEFIQYLDADDLLMPDAVEKRVVGMRIAGVDVAYSDWETFSEIQPGVFQVGEQVARRMEDVHPSPEVAMLTGFWVPLAALLYRRSIVEKVGGWKEWLPVMEDGRFLQDAVLAGASFMHVPGVGARYRVHRASLSRCIDQAAVVWAVFRNTCDLQEGLKAKGGTNTEQRRALAQIYNHSARSLFFQDRVAFRECVARLYEVEPGFRPSWPKVAQLTSAILGVRAARPLLAALKGLHWLCRQPQRLIRL